ncbi:TetR/AcrR family transcriptional regulator [Methyloglobulus morosus]|nr:TetR/AcrR family transcriptional regulator [Methyloglobulus morosus]
MKDKMEQETIEIRPKDETWDEAETQEKTEIQDNVEPRESVEVQKKNEAPDEILLAALKLFSQKGFFNTSLTDIAKQAGLKNTSAVYPHFKNKQAIATQLYANILDSLSASIDDIRCKNPKSSGQLRGIVDLLFKLTDDAPDIMRFLLILKLDEFLPDEKSMLESPPFIKIHKIIQSGIKAGEIRNIDPILVNAYFFGIINTTLRFKLTGMLEKAADAYQGQAWIAAWNVIAKK